MIDIFLTLSVLVNVLAIYEIHRLTTVLRETEAFNVYLHTRLAGEMEANDNLLKYRPGRLP